MLNQERIAPNIYRCVMSSLEKDVYYLLKSKTTWLIKQNGEVIDFPKNKAHGFEMIEQYFKGELV